MSNFKNTCIVVVSFAIIGFAGSIEAANLKSFKINTENVISIKNRVDCNSTKECMDILNKVRDIHKGASLTFNKKNKYISFTVKTDCTKSCYDDVSAFMSGYEYSEASNKPAAKKAPKKASGKATESVDTK